MGTHEIRHPGLYAAAYKALAASSPRVEWAPESGEWHHATPVKYGLAAVRQVLQLRADSAAASYRWSGKRPAVPGVATPASQASKYFSRTLSDALLGEITSYACGTSLDADVRRMVNADPKDPKRLTPAGFAAALVARRVVVLEAMPGWRFADLSPASDRGQEALGRVLKLLYATPAVRDELRKAGYALDEPSLEAFTSPEDHSLGAAIGHWVWDARPKDGKVGGLKVSSMQSDAGLHYGDPDGDNLVCIGPPDSTIAALRPLRVISFEPTKGGGTRSETRPYAVAVRS